MYRLDDDQVLRAPALEAFSWLEHGFGTKLSGDRWPLEDERATLKQIHSTVVVVADRPGALGEGDGLVANRPGIFVAVKTADCIPVLLVDPVRRAVAAVHAGWRGTAGNIVRTAIDTLVSEYHAKPGDLWGAIGPGIGQCCYEVSGSVARQFAGWIPELNDAGDRTMLDLTGINRQQLIEAGVDRAHVLSTEEWCTKCHPDTLHSFRRDAMVAGRMYSAIRIR